MPVCEEPSIELFINAEGDIVCIYDDDTVDILEELGRIQTPVRASRVEPCPGGTWYADMTPVGGTVLTGFNRRSEALDAERRWINSHLDFVAGVLKRSTTC